MSVIRYNDPTPLASIDWTAKLEDWKREFKMKAEKQRKPEKDILLAMAKFDRNPAYLPSTIKLTVTDASVRTLTKLIITSYLEENLKFKIIAGEYLTEAGLSPADLKTDQSVWGTHSDKIITAVSLAFAEYMASNLYDRFAINELCYGLSLSRELGYDLVGSGSFEPGLPFNTISGDTSAKGSELVMALAVGPNQAQFGWITEIINGFKGENSKGFSTGYHHLLYAFVPPVIHEMLFDRYILRNRRAKFFAPVDRSAGRTTAFNKVRVANAYYSTVFTVMPQAYKLGWKINANGYLNETAEVLAHSFIQEEDGNYLQTVALGPEFNGNTFPRRKSISEDELSTNLKSRLQFVTLDKTLFEQLAKLYMNRSASLTMSKGMRVLRAQSRSFPLVLSVNYGDLFNNLEWDTKK